MRPVVPNDRSMDETGNSTAHGGQALAEGIGPRVETLFAGGISPVGPAGYLSGIRKRRLDGPAEVTTEGVVGDEIFDRSVHGGPDRAMNVFASEYYEQLKASFPEPEEPWQPGGFGENLSISGLLDHEVRVGDVYRLGEVLVQVTQPRAPCAKLNGRFGLNQLARHVQQNRMTGWYVRVLKTGRLAAGEPMVLVSRGDEAYTLDRFWDLVLNHESPDRVALARLAAYEPLSQEWKDKLTQRVDRLRAKDGVA